MHNKNLSTEEAFAQGVQNQQKNNLAVAIEFYKQTLEKDPNHLDANNNLGVILLRKGDLNNAIANFQKVIAINPEYAHSYNNLGIIFMRLKEYKKAKENFKKAIQIMPDFFLAHNNFGNLLQEIGDYNEAKKCYEKVIQIKPEFSSAYNNLGVIFNEVGETKKAKNLYEKAIKITPNYIAAYNNLGILFNDIGEDRKAIECFQKIIKIKSDVSDAYYNLGNTYRKKKDFKKAAEFFNQVNSALSDAQFLECVYLSNNLKKYKKLLKSFAESHPTNLRISALTSYVSKIENIENIYPFCKNPLNYFFSVNLKKEFINSNNFEKKILQIPEKIITNWRNKSIIKNGYQSTGNLLDSSITEIVELKKLIEKQINIYRKKFIKSSDYYISKWPGKSNLFGWYIKLKKQGQLKSHMHPTGWLSGVFYLKIPKSIKNNEGSINLSLQGLDYPTNKNLPNIFFSPKPFDLILYPSSLFHNTVPFNSNEERHCIAFDVTPSN